MSHQKIVRFFRISCQGIGVASLGTLGITPKWSSFVLGMVMLIISLAIMTFEGED